MALGVGASVSAAHAQSTGTVTGQVVDQTGAPLPGANVVVQGTQIGEATDQNGRYRLSGVPVGEQTLVASFVGYETARATVTIRPGEETVVQDFRLDQAAIEAQEVIVVGQRGILRTLETKRQALGSSTCLIWRRFSAFRCRT